VKKIIIIIVILLIAIGGASAIIFSNLSKKFNSYIDQITLEHIDMTTIPDGIYTGTSDSVVVKAIVEIEVEDHIIIKIEILEHRTGRGREGEKVIYKILEEQRVDVDGISGATFSSLIIQDAVQKALLSSI
jgi:uncharacterized protein with FMN-binding domain